MMNRKKLPCRYKLQLRLPRLHSQQDNNQASYCISHPFTHVHLKSLVWVPLYCILFSLDPYPQSNQSVILPYSNQIFAAQLNIKSMYTDMQSLY